jgi:hypothetical protein
MYSTLKWSSESNESIKYIPRLSLGEGDEAKRKSIQAVFLNDLKEDKSQENKPT